MKHGREAGEVAVGRRKAKKVEEAEELGVRGSSGIWLSSLPGSQGHRCMSEKNDSKTA